MKEIKELKIEARHVVPREEWPDHQKYRISLNCPAARAATELFGVPMIACAICIVSSDQDGNLNEEWRCSPELCNAIEHYDAWGEFRLGVYTITRGQDP